VAPAEHVEQSLALASNPPEQGASAEEAGGLRGSGEPLSAG